MQHFLHFVSAVEPSVDSKVPYEFHGWQHALMTKFYEDISEKGKIALSDNYPERDYCTQWKGVTCTQGVVRNISYVNEDIGNFNIYALPPSVEMITLWSSHQCFEIQTRSLPRNVTGVSLLINKIFGRIDLGTLPQVIQYFNASGNRITGPVDLTRLPMSLKELGLSWNKITQEVVFYANLPPKLKKVELVAANDGQKIGEFQPLYPQDAVNNKEIFANFPPDKLF